MKEYIEREAAIHAVVKSYWSKPYVSNVELAQAVRDVPAADVVERKRGGCELCKSRWIDIEVRTVNYGGTDTYVFSTNEAVGLMYCPMCGADMREVDHEGVH